jgi:hypothetical protein
MEIRSLARAASHTSRRVLCARLLQRLALALPIPLSVGLLALTWIKLARPTDALAFGGWPAAGLPSWLWAVVLASALAPIAAVLSSLFTKRPVLLGAQLLDRHHGLQGRVANALAFSAERSPSDLMRAAIDDALQHAGALDPGAAAPIKVPSELGVSALLVVALLVLARFEVPSARFVEDPVAGIVPLTMAADDLDLLRENAALLSSHSDAPEVQAAARRFNQLIEDIANRRLDRQEVFQRLGDLESALTEQGELEREGLDDGLSGLAEELAKNDLTKPAADALQQKKLADAEAAFRELAKRLRERPGSVNKTELERLRKALEQASKQTTERSERIEQQRQALSEERRRLLDKKKQQPNEALSKQDQQALEQKERQLKRLDRQKKATEQGAQQMSKLDQELAKAAADLMKEMGDAAQDLNNGAQELNRMQQQKLSDADKEALKKQIEELRQMLRQNQGNSDERKKMMEQFSNKAHGQKGGKPGSSGSTPGGQGQQGNGSGSSGTPQLRLGAGQGQSIPIPMGQQPGAAAGEGQGQGMPGGATGSQAGNGTDPNLKGERSEAQGQAHDVAAAGIDSGQGEAASEVVYGAAERGFGGSGYKKVYTDYKTVAEEVMQTDEIPPGYRFYVRRYFQLIRPRE